MMTKLKATLGAVVMAGLITTIVRQHRSNGRLRAELERWRAPAAEAIQTATNAGSAIDAGELERWRAEHLELMRLRAQVSALRETQTSLTNAQSEISRLQNRLKTAPALAGRSAAQESPPLAPGLKAAADFQNLGNLTPTSSFETALWASGAGDTNALAKSMTFDAESRLKAEEVLANAPEAIRERFETVEELLAYMFTRTTPTLGMRVFEEEQVSPTHFRLQAESQYRDGRLQANSWHFHRAPGGEWQMLIEPGMVDKMGRMLSAEAASIVARAP